MQVTSHFIYIVLYAIVFVMATTAIIFILKLTNEREDVVVADMHEKASITTTMSERLDESKEEVYIKGSSIYTDILGIVESYSIDELGLIHINIGSTPVQTDILRAMKLHEGEAGLKQLKDSGIISLSGEYKKVYTYYDNLAIESINYIRQ